MTNWIASKAYRVLRHMDNYTNFYSYTYHIQKELPNRLYLKDILFQENEQLLGVYENNPGKVEDCIVVTDLGFHMFLENDWKSVKFAEIEKVDAAGEKFLKSGLNLYLTNGKVISIPIRGGKGQFTDKWEFLRFTKWVMGK